VSRKPIELADTNLWDEVKQSVKPLRRKAAAVRTAKAASATSQSVAAAKAVALAQSGIVQHRPAKHDVPPPLAAMDRRTAQRLSRGQIEPEARLDLHGEGLETARMHLLHFLAANRHRGHRLVLVITGKGASPFARHTLHGTSHFNAPEREGRLRREVPLWLHEENFRLHAVGFQPAHPKHGGGGAFYVRLRKPGHMA
jgi:DNA-nicking Smr family endonuclease